MFWIIAGGLALLYIAASMSRTRKQKIVQQSLSQNVRQELGVLYASRFGTRESGATPAEIDAMARRYFQSLLELFSAHDFGSLMRAMTKRADDSWAIEREVVDRLVAMVPGTGGNSLLAATEWSRIDRALTSAGEAATLAGRASGEI